ncbi:MAG: septation regulator SpoVG [Clostridiales Family XIII bacterium]|nr:septation regulator SpoVG [Clostridiales Family XIII bacterium]
MQITDVRIRKVNDEGKMRAIVSVTFDDEFVVHDIKVIEGQNGLFIAMPSRKMGEGDFRDIAHPLTSETRNRIKEAIFEEYHKVLEAREAEKGQEVTAVETEEKEAEAAQAIEMYDEEVVPALKQK